MFYRLPNAFQWAQQRAESISHGEGKAGANYTELTRSFKLFLLWFLVGGFIPSRLTFSGTIDFTVLRPWEKLASLPSPQERLWCPWASYQVLSLLTRDQVGLPFHQKGSEQTKTAEDHFSFPLSQLLTDTRSLLSESLVSKLRFPLVPKVWVKRHPRLLHLCSTPTDLWVFSPMGLNNWVCFMKYCVWKDEFLI